MSDGRFGPRLGMGLMNCDGNSQEGGLVGSWIRGPCLVPGSYMNEGTRETDGRQWSWVAVKIPRGGCSLLS